MLTRDPQSFGDYNAILLSPDANTAFQYFAPLIVSRSSNPRRRCSDSRSSCVDSQCAISQSFFVHRTFSVSAQSEHQNIVTNSDYNLKATKNYFVLAVLGLLTLVTLAVGWAETSVSLITNVSFTKVLMWVQVSEYNISISTL